MPLKKILVFGGTSEGRIIYEEIKKAGIEAVLSVATDYGKEIVDETDKGIIVNRLSEGEMEELVACGFDLVADATHPHAREVSPAIKKACTAKNVPLIRVLREFNQGDEAGFNVMRFDTLSEAVSFLNTQEGGVLAATGAKEFPEYRNLRDYENRVYARVLPAEASVKACREAGIASSRIIAMQGPFSAGLNSAIIREFGCRWLVTKDTGVRGGYYEKLQAAKECGIIALVINAPKEEGVSLDEALKIIRKMA